MKSAFVALVLASFTGPTGLRLDVNPEKISTIREPSSVNTGHWAKGVNCIIVIGTNRTVAVHEDCNEVRKRIGGLTGEPPKPCVLVCGETRSEGPKR